jgi:protein-tyrosine phosphatase
LPHPSPPDAARRRRDLDWEGCLNVRDLGGHPTRDGGETRYGEVVRADSIRQLTRAGWEAAVAYGIRTAVDLRGEHELRDDPPDELPIDVVHVAFMEANEEDWRSVEAELRAIVDSSPEPAALTRDFYLTFLEHFRENAAAGVRAVARAPAGGVVVHCVGGKDRTGLLCAFLLDLAGVAAEEIAADYGLSEERLRPRHEAWLAEAETEAERERIHRISRTPPEAMLGVFAELDRRHGGVAGYLRDAGLSAEELQLAARRLAPGGAERA